MIFDTHAHYDDKRFNEDRDAVLQKVRDAGVGLILNAGSSMKSSERSVALAQKYTYIFASVGVHPHNAEHVTDDDINTLMQMAKTSPDRVCAFGEIGLDYYYDHSPRDLQVKAFRKQIDAAKQLELPVIIHSRDATKETLDILRSENAGENGGVLHCFSGSPEVMHEVVRMGFYVSFGGVVTFKNAVKAIASVREIPIERLLIETDCPYLAPTPFRGERNDSSYLSYVIEKIADIRAVSPEEIETRTFQNGLDLFRQIVP